MGTRIENWFHLIKPIGSKLIASAFKTMDLDRSIAAWSRCAVAGPLHLFEPDARSLKSRQDLKAGQFSAQSLERCIRELRLSLRLQIFSAILAKSMQNDPDRSNGVTRELYQQTMLALRLAFTDGASAADTLQGRSDAIDGLIDTLWRGASGRTSAATRGLALVAVGGYGRRELFPHSDVDLIFLLDSRVSTRAVGARPVEQAHEETIRWMSQALWDCGPRLSTQTRKLNECDRFDASNAEFTLSLLDRRLVAGDPATYHRLDQHVLPRALRRDRNAILRRLADLTATRHARYGGTLFHLEPNIKDCPGGLRDVHVCGWTSQLLALGGGPKPQPSRNHPGSDQANDGGNDPDHEFQQAVAFLKMLRCFLHFRHDRDDNILNWQAQDAAAAAAIGLDRKGLPRPDAAYWMRLYFRNARVVERRVVSLLEAVSPASTGRFGRLAELRSSFKHQLRPGFATRGFAIEQGAIAFAPADAGLSGHRHDPAHDPETVLAMFEVMSKTGCRLGSQAEERLSDALPLLSADLEEGLALWRHIEAILTGPFAGIALRAMHALGILELLVPEFHGIDALVIRDAYHRYTVDEHTFVLIDTLHGLEAQPLAFLAGAAQGTSASRAAPNSAKQGDSKLGDSKPGDSKPGDAGPKRTDPLIEWSSRLGQLLRDLQQPGLLYLMALLHDTGKGRSTGDHARESARMAGSVLSRLELDGYESSLILRLITSHLEMSAALRRDIFDTDTVRAFAAKVQTPEALRMLTLFTYADIQAVHPGALTPWKAENLWRLYLATSNYLDRSVDEERVGIKAENELVLRVTATIPDRRAEVEEFLAGLPARYLATRTPEQVRTHFQLSTRLAEDAVQLDLHYSPAISEITLITPDRPTLFANMAGVIAAWGMNIVTADAFSNRQGTVLDSFRFTDAFRTLQMNASERERFVASVHDVTSGAVLVEALLQARRRGPRKPPMVEVAARVDFDDTASSHSTLLQVIAQDTPGLLRVLSLILSAHHCNIEVALVDTEGETAIDVFYITRNHAKLNQEERDSLRDSLLRAIKEHGR